MNVNFQNLPSPSKLIMTMDKHPIGACLFVMTLFIGIAGLLGFTWLWFSLHVR